MNRYLVWVSGPSEERTAPWWELPLQVSGDDPGEAIAKAVAWCREQGRAVDRVTATLMPATQVRPPVGEFSPSYDELEAPPDL